MTAFDWKGELVIEQALYRASKAKGHYINKILDRVKRAPKFVLDDSMSSFLADVEAERKSTNYKLAETVKLARVPYDSVWVEFNHQAYMDRMMMLQGQRPLIHNEGRLAEREELIPKIGFALWRESDTEYVAVAISMSRSGVMGNFPLAMRWNVERPLTEQVEILSELVLGVECHKPGHGDAIRHVKMEKLETTIDMVDVVRLMKEWVSWGACLLSFLSVVNDIPTYKTDVKAPHGTQRRKNYQQFIDYSVVTLQVPTPVSVGKLASSVLEQSRRRAHQVRGHWRLYHRGEGVLCHRETHYWGPGANIDEVKCTKCPAWKAWVPDHQRGDASLGFVLHDYEVTKS